MLEVFLWRLVIHPFVGLSALICSTGSREIELYIICYLLDCICMILYITNLFTNENISYGYFRFNSVTEHLFVELSSFSYIYTTLVLYIMVWAGDVFVIVKMWHLCLCLWTVMFCIIVCNRIMIVFLTLLLWFNVIMALQIRLLEVFLWRFGLHSFVGQLWYVTLGSRGDRFVLMCISFWIVHIWLVLYRQTYLYMSFQFMDFPL